MQDLGHLCRAVCVAAAVALLGGSGCSKSSRSRGPLPADLEAREAAAARDMQLFLDSYLEDYPWKRVGAPDPSFLVPGFELDGWDRSGYLGEFWVADDAEALDGKGATLVYYDGDWIDYYDVYVNGALSPYDMGLPVLGEYYLAGETYFDGALDSEYESLWSFFMLENPDDTFSFVAPGPAWEAAWLVDPPEDFHFIVDRVTVNGDRLYQTVNDTHDPNFLYTKIEAEAGAVLVIDALLTAYGIPGPLFVDVTATVRLFNEGSFSEAQFAGVGNTKTSQDLKPYFADNPVVSSVLQVPHAAAAGWYNLIIYVENFVGEVYATDRISIPIEVIP